MILKQPWKKDIHEKKTPIQATAAAHGIPISKVTLFDYASGHVEVGSKRGPESILTAAEEKRLVDCVTHMAEIGYGCSREQIWNTVKTILDKDGQANPTNLEENGGHFSWSAIPPLRCNLLSTFSYVEYVPEALHEWYSLFSSF